MRKLLVILSVVLCIPAHVQAGIPVTCTNCSQNVLQMLEHAKQLEELMEAVQQTQELYKNSAQNLEMIQQNVDQYNNMLKNTVSLPQELKEDLVIQLKYLVRSITDMQTHYGDMGALQEIFERLYPGFRELANETTDNNVPLEERQEAYEERYERWSEEANRAAKQAFGLSGRQLQNLVDSGEFEDQVQTLLETPEGQKEALDAANQLAGMQLDEARHLRALIATHIQAQQQLEMKRESEAQVQEAQERSFYMVEQPYTPVDLPTGFRD